MMRSMRYLLVVLFTGFTVSAFAQGQSGSISGTILDEKKEAMIGAVIQAYEGGILKGGSATDPDGQYLIKPLAPGTYEVRIQFATYRTKVVSGVLVSPDKNVTINATMELNPQELQEVTVKWEPPLVDPNSGGGAKVMTADDIKNMPTRSTQSMISTANNVYQKEAGSNDLNIAGGRSDATKYIVDGIPMYGSNGSNMTQDMIAQMEVLSSGIPAKYGDAIGGVVSITTRGISKDFRGGVLLEKSADAYNHNLASFNLSGPFLSKKDSTGAKTPLVGFVLGGEVWYDGDRRPSYGGNYVVKEDVVKQLEAQPLKQIATQSGNPVFRNASEYLRMEDLEIVKRRPNTDVLEARGNAKLDFQVTPQLNITASGQFGYTKTSLYSKAWSYIASDAIPDDHSFNGRGFLRLTQRFGKSTYGEEKEKPLISNAYYSLQADYQRDYLKREDPTFKTDPFRYGYVGKFFTDYATTYAPGTDDSSGRTGIVLQSDRFAKGISYQRSDINPLLANYTSQYFEQSGANPTSLQQIQTSGGLVNGDLPRSTYERWFSAGQTYTGYVRRAIDQVGLNVDASFDFQPAKTRHQIEFGLYYQQQVHKVYTMQPANTQGGQNIWAQMRLLANSHIEFDKSQPIWVKNGQQYTWDDVKNGNYSPSPSDTIIYNRKADAITQSTFDKNLRAKLGLGATDYINVDELDPSTYSIDMFSADELLNDGQNFVNYNGYTHTGKKQKGQVNFNDFFTKKDANGVYTREIGAYRPNYIAGYILDKFQFKDVNFNAGLRIERFDANTKMLKDPYSLYEVRTVSDINDKDISNPLNDGAIPGNIKDNYVVYVNNAESSKPTIVGYRNGDDWYDYNGKQIEDPNVLKNFSGGRDPQPWLVDNKTKITDSTYDPSTSFTDYKPQVNVMPRLSFSFPISDVALFYAHYDVLVQRPSINATSIYATAADYYFFTARPAQLLLNNPALKPEKRFDYEVGFKQRISDRSALTISGSYQERKDMIQVRPYLYAYPRTYFTFGNRDFSTYKALTLRYDLRRTNNLRMDIAYTLSFAEGTGSSSNSGNGGSSSFVSQNSVLTNFIAAGLPNLRYTTALSYDSRHQLVATIDYRYEDKQGPVVAGEHIFENAGVNFIFRARSGEPYTRKTDAYEKIVKGELNGSRLPWHFGIDGKIDKDFVIGMGKKSPEGVRTGKPLTVNAFVFVQNIFNIKDVLNVDDYTGRPDNDGYLVDPHGIQDVQQRADPQSFIDIYTVNLINPANINMPRRINVGLQINF
jgi:outer membrane receptor protein involved in Fe transport